LDPINYCSSSYIHHMSWKDNIVIRHALYLFFLVSCYYGFGWHSKIIWLIISYISCIWLVFRFFILICTIRNLLMNMQYCLQKNFTNMGEGIWTTSGRWSSMEKVWPKKDPPHWFPKVYLIIHKSWIFFTQYFCKPLLYLTIQ
jgi:hypothetical protein